MVLHCRISSTNIQWLQKNNIITYPLATARGYGIIEVSKLNPLLNYYNFKMDPSPTMNQSIPNCEANATCFQSYKYSKDNKQYK